MAEQRQVPLPGLEPVGHDAPTEPAPAVGSPGDKPGLHVRLFGSSQFFHLWLTQVASATGDWLGFLAIAALAANIAEGSPAAAVGVVMSARIVPGFFLGPAAGVIVDRFDRKRVMVTCDLGRAAVLVTLPFVDTGPGAGGRLARARVLHAAVDARQGGVGPEPRAARPPHHGQLAVARSPPTAPCRSRPACSRCSPG